LYCNKKGSTRGNEPGGRKSAKDPNGASFFDMINLF